MSDALHEVNILKTLDGTICASWCACHQDECPKLRTALEAEWKTKEPRRG